MGHLAYLVAKRRDQAELKQRDLARELGVDEGTITRPETGSSWTDTYVILRVCERLAIPLTLPALRDLEPLEPADGSEA